MHGAVVDRLVQVQAESAALLLLCAAAIQVTCAVLGDCAAGSLSDTRVSCDSVVPALTAVVKLRPSPSL